jgi:ribosomal protein S7
MVRKNLKIKLINLKMKKGKKYLSEKQLFVFFKLFQRRNKKDLNSFFKHALVKLTPIVSTKKVTRNTDNTVRYYPYVLRKDQRIALSLKHLVKPSSILDCLNVQDWVVMLADKLVIRKDLHEQAFQDKKLLKYRWFF